MRNYPKALILGAVQFLLMMLSTFSLSGYGFLIGIMSVMALFRYILAYYILLDEPRQSPIRILSKSNYLMFGNKARMASLLISFIGWFLLASLLSSCVQYLMFPGLVDEIRQAAQIMVNSDMQTASEAFSQMDMTSLIASERSIAFAVIKNIISAAPYAYVFTSAACFYDYAAGNLVTQTGGEADPVSPFAPSAAVIDPEDEPSENNYE